MPRGEFSRGRTRMKPVAIGAARPARPTTSAIQILLCAALGISATTLAAESNTRPFKLGTFDAQGRTFVGAVLDDALVIDLDSAATALRRPAGSAPRDMRDLIARYDSGGRDLIAAAIAGATGNTRPAY